MSTSPDQLAQILRLTPRGSLQYDRSPTSPSSTCVQSLNASFQAVVEEVVEEVHDMKVQNLYDVTLGLNILSARERRYPSPVTEEAPVADPRSSKTLKMPKRTINSDVPRSPSGQIKYSRVVSSPVDEKLLQLELQSIDELAYIKWNREDNVRRCQEKFRSSLLTQIKNMDDMAKEEAMKEDEVEKENREATQRLLADQQMLQDKARKRMMASLKDIEQNKLLEKKRHLQEKVPRLADAVSGLESLASSFNAESPAGISAIKAINEARVLLTRIQEVLSGTAEYNDNLENSVTSTLIVLKQREVLVRQEKLDEESKRLANEEKSKQEEQRQQQLIQEQDQQRQLQEEQLRQQAQQRQLEDEQRVSGTNKLHPFGSQRNHRLFEELMNMKTECQVHLNPLTSSIEDRTFRFNCQKAVNTPVNAINSVSANHLRDKLNKLKNLLQGLPVDVGGDTQFSAAANPLGILYCKSLLAKRLVSQGADVVSSKPELAFSMAAVVVALWSSFADFGQLFLAQLLEACPYLIPIHFDRQNYHSDEEYYKRMGYQYNQNQEIEKQDKFISHMSGLARLYAAITVSCLPQDYGEQDHPHGLGNVWRYIGSQMNLQPKNDITAIVILDILDVTGHALISSYGKLFFKLLAMLQENYFSMIKEVTAEGAGGPLSRLDEFLKNAIQTGKIEKKERC